MNPKEKAQELKLKFLHYAYYPKTKDDEVFSEELNKNAKQCALIAVDEILANYVYGSCFDVKYWQKVKREIEKL